MTNEKQITVSRTTEAPAQVIFDILTNPEQHVQLDGSGFIRSAETQNRIHAVGDVFTMNMEGEHMGGEYQTDNHVTGFDDDRLLAWKTAPAGTEPPGWEWVWDLEAEGPNETEVTLTYDWSKVTDKEILKKVHFPLVSKEDLEQSLSRLAEIAPGHDNA